jgi:hypothetical protein
MLGSAPTGPDKDHVPWMATEHPAAQAVIAPSVPNIAHANLNSTGSAPPRMSHRPPDEELALPLGFVPTKSTCPSARLPSTGATVLDSVDGVPFRRQIRFVAARVRQRRPGARAIRSWHA